MAVMGPLWAGDPPPRRPADRWVLLRTWLFGLAAVSLVIAVGFLGWQLARLAAPTVVRRQIDVIDANTEAPPRPHLPASPFER
ncbi:hypothetical protein AB0C02_00560 [Micromonospora sp. NPDC048999]|uniref:hypothetical protein n=1 Tax=Micromonospora sp. NPDC048999 TaxID=3155391 RepID=UPI0033E60CE8